MTEKWRVWSIASKPDFSSPAPFKHIDAEVLYIVDIESPVDRDKIMDVVEQYNGLIVLSLTNLHHDLRTQIKGYAAICCADNSSKTYYLGFTEVGEMITFFKE
jgi:hypothetical protein